MDISGSNFQRFLEKLNNLAKNIRQDRLVVVMYLLICHKIRDKRYVQADCMH